MLIFGEILSFKWFCVTLALYELVLWLLRIARLGELLKAAEGKLNQDAQKKLIVLKGWGVDMIIIQSILETLEERRGSRISVIHANSNLEQLRQNFPTMLDDAVVLDTGMLTRLPSKSYKLISEILESIPHQNLLLYSCQPWSLLSWVSPFEIPARCFIYSPPKDDFIYSQSNPVYGLYRYLEKNVLNLAGDRYGHVNSIALRCTLFTALVFLVKYILL